MVIADIKIESILKQTELYDITNFRKKYIIPDEKIVIMDGPLIELLSNNFDYLMQNSVSVNMDKRYFKRPDYLANDIYGTTNLWFLLLYINNCFSLEEFQFDKVIIPTKEAVNHVLQNYTKGEIITIQEE